MVTSAGIEFEAPFNLTSVVAVVGGDRIVVQARRGLSSELVVGEGRLAEQGVVPAPPGHFHGDLSGWISRNPRFPGDHHLWLFFGSAASKKTNLISFLFSFFFFLFRSPVRRLETRH